MARHTLWNMLGMGGPLLIGLIALKVLPNAESGLGAKKMEMLGIVWMLVGFTSIFDMGLGRALTKNFAHKLSAGRYDELHGLFWTAFSMIIGIGVLIGAAVILAIPLITRGEVDPVLHLQSSRSFLIVGLFMPVMLLNVGMSGVLQATQHFKLLNMIRIPSGSLTFLSPLCVLLFSRRLDVVVLVLIIGRFAETAAYMLGCMATMPSLKRAPVFRRTEMQALIGFGSWMTLSNATVGVMTFINRFIIRTVRKLGEGTYYLIPEELLVRALMIPRAWNDVLFPAFVTSFNTEGEKPGDLFEKGMLYLLLVMTPVTMVMALVLPDFLVFWLPDGKVFMQKSLFVVHCLTLGVFIHGFGRVAWFFVQAAGRPDTAAKWHLLELLVYMPGAYLLISCFGINGAALAWTIRVTVDFILLMAVSMRHVDAPARILARTALPIAGVTVLALLAMQPQALAVRLILGGLFVGAFYALCWVRIFTRNERDELLGFVQSHLAFLRRKGVK
jgi:O-antigen/teichoic acid export membrane protein